MFLSRTCYALALVLAASHGIGYSWTPTDLTHSSGATGTVGALTSYSVQNTEHVVYLDRDHACVTGPNNQSVAPCGHIVEIFNNGSDHNWYAHDLTLSASARGAAIDSTLTSYTIGTSQHVIYVDLDGHVVELYNAGSEPDWHRRNLTASAGAPVVSAPLLSSFVVGSTEHVICFAAGHVYELFNNGYDPVWHAHDLTASAEAPAPRTDSLTSYAAGASQHVIFIDSRPGTVGGHVWELYNDGSETAWHPHDLTASAGDNGLASSKFGGLASFTVGTSQHVIYKECAYYSCDFGTTTLHELYNSGAEPNWHTADLKVSWDAPVTAFWFKQRIQAVAAGVLLGDRDVWEYSITLGGGQQSNVKINSAAGTPKAFGFGWPLTTYITAGSQHIVYVDSAGHIQNLSN